MKQSVTVKTGARTEKVERQADGSLRLSVHAPPVEGRANDAAIRLLAGFFSVPRSGIRLVSGVRSKHKIFEIGQ